MSDDVTLMLINELNTIHNENVEIKLIEERKNTLDFLIQSALENKIIEENSQSLPFTDIYKSIWEELKILETHENSKELLTLISGFNDDLSILERMVRRNSDDNPEIPNMGKEELKIDISNIFNLLESLKSRSTKIDEVALKCWKKEEYKNCSSKYLELERIKGIFKNTKIILNEAIGKDIENIKWPLQADLQEKEQELLIRSLGLFAGDIIRSEIPAIECFNEFIMTIPKYVSKHYVERLRIRMQYHFSEDIDISTANRPELILNYTFDQLKVLKQYIDDIGKQDAFLAIRDLVIDDIMLILIDNYKHKHKYLINRMSIFFMYLEEVSQFQSKLNQHFGYSCNNAHSLFYHILNDKIRNESISTIWKKLDIKLAEKRITEILNDLYPEMVEEIETLLEHYITSYSTLPKEIRIEFYENAEEFILTRVFNFFNNYVESKNYWQLLKKSTTKEFIKFDIILGSMIKCIMRQRERLAGNIEAQECYKDIINKLERTKQKFYENCAIHIYKSLFSILRKDIDKIKDQTEKPVKFIQSAKQLVEKLFRKFMSAELTQTVEEIVTFIFNLIEKQLKEGTWIKLVERFKKEIIKQQLFEMWMVFVENLPKVEENLSTWRMKIEQELNK